MLLLHTLPWSEWWNRNVSTLCCLCTIPRWRVTDPCQNGPPFTTCGSLSIPHQGGEQIFELKMKQASIQVGLFPPSRYQMLKIRHFRIFRPLLNYFSFSNLCEGAYPNKWGFYWCWIFAGWKLHPFYVALTGRLIFNAFWAFKHNKQS